MIRDDLTIDRAEAPPLSPRGWVLLPLLILALLGLVVPISAVEFREPAPPVERPAVYEDELLPLLGRLDLDGEAQLAIRDFHERLRAAMSTHGGITSEEAGRARRLIERYGTKPR